MALGNRYGVYPLLVCCAAALLWYLITPPFEAPDEHSHFGFVRYLAAERRLPDARPEIRRGWESHEWIQPPVYYMLLAPVVAAVGADAPPPVLRNPNDRFNYGTSTRAFIWDGQRSRGSDAVLWARFASLLLGVFTIVLIYKAAAAVLQNNQQAAVVASTLAMIPQFTFLIAALSNDTLATMMSTATVAALVTIWSARGLSLRTAALAGFCAGAAVVTKISAAYLFPMIAVGVLWRGHRQIGRAIGFLAVTAGTAGVVAGWYFVRNILVFGDVLANRFKMEIVSDVATPLGRTLTDPYFYKQFPADMFLSFWGRFGWLTMTPPPAALMVYAVLTGAIAGATGAYLIEMIRAHRSGRAERRTLAAVAVAFGLFIGWRAYRFALVVPLPAGLTIGHIEAGIAAALASFACLILATRGTRADRREQQIALTLAFGVMTMMAELVYYNLSWHSSQARLMYPALAPMAIVGALAVRAAGRKLPPAPVWRWAAPAAIAALGAAWIASYAAAFNGWHVAG